MVTDEELCAFGIGFDDDGFHPRDPADPTWNESWFWDWYDDEGALAGHCRFGTMPGQDRAWVWCYQRYGDAWLVIDQPWLDGARVARPQVAIDAGGLTCSYQIDQPLRSGRLHVAGPARIIGGPDDGRVVPLRVALEVRALGAAHSTGAGAAPGHRSEGYDARRYEQPIAVEGTLSVAGVVTPIEGRGERDHSWGPRYWDIEWSFLVLNGADRRLMCVEVRFEGGETIEIGYLQDPEGTHDLTEVVLEVHRRPSLADALDASVVASAAGGRSLAASIVALATHEMDLSHVLAPGSDSTYRRTLVRATPSDGGPPMLGWLEDHVLVRQPLAVAT